MSRDRLRQPPSSITGELGRYLSDMCKEINAMPNMSMFSGVNPSVSAITGVRGDIAVNVGNISSSSILFVHYGSALNPDRTSWNGVA